MHSQNITHRDIKPANILITKDKVVKIADLGSSRTIQGRMFSSNIAALPYRAPECFHGKYDQKMDVWAAGCVLYEMITLRPPFRAENMEGLYNKVIKGQFSKIPEKFSNDLCKSLGMGHRKLALFT